MLVEIGSWLQVPHTVRVLLGGESDFRIQKDLQGTPARNPHAVPWGPVPGREGTQGIVRHKMPVTSWSVRAYQVRGNK